MSSDERPAPIDAVLRTDRCLLFVLLSAMLIYTLAHFGYSGIHQPLFSLTGEHAIGQVMEETVPLITSLDTGDAVETSNPRQYGPVFLTVMRVLLWFTRDVGILEILLYCVGLASLFAALWCCFQGIFARERHGVIAGFLLLAVWLNFGPVYYILGVKNVELWELFLLSLAFLSVERGRRFLAGTAVAAASLIKFLPGIYVVYWLFSDRRAFVGAVIAGIVMLIVATVFFGPAMGLLYPATVAHPLQSRTWAVSFFENVAIKGTIYKYLSGFDHASDQWSFGISGARESVAFGLSLACQLAGILYIIWLGRRRDCSRHERWVHFALVSVIMLLISPISAAEYTVLYLVAYSIGLYFLLYHALPWRFAALYLSSYLFLGGGIPSSWIIRALPLPALLSYFDMAYFTPLEAYRVFSFPLVGMLLLLAFFVLLLREIRAKAL